ncbi:hypothetical protein GCM10010435_16130 [Winogradskya consettensis]|uniref:Uncharacterized protein n=1 Tax=Winogradskya consettensis TaxID=113560 RepID=A0A919SBQ1_9ACTN|nr:hypothetical protein Aco04nite_15400 [Actinoplanes consettensis]
MALLALAHTQRFQPYLAVTVREGAAVIGPFVPPTGQPCLNCITLYRQFQGTEIPAPTSPTPRQHDPRPEPRYDEFRVSDEPLAVATTLAACGYVIAEVLTFIDGGIPETLGAEVEISSPRHIRRRSWMPHPYCTCTQNRRQP